MIETRTVRLTGLAVLVLYLIQAPGLRAEEKREPRADFAVELAPLLKKFCFSCHSAKRKKGDIDIESALGSQPLAKLDG